MRQDGVKIAGSLAIARYLKNSNEPRRIELLISWLSDVAPTSRRVEMDRVVVQFRGQKVACGRI